MPSSSWHANTKTVRSYGKQRNRVVKVLVDLSDSPALNKTLPPAPTDDDPSSPSKRLFPASSASNKSTSGVLKDKNGREGSVEPIPDKDGKRKVSGSHKEKADKPAQEKIQPLKQEEEEDEDEDEDILFDVPSREKIVAPPKPRLTRVVNPPTSVPPHVLPSRSATKSIRSPVPAPRSTRSTSSSPISVSSSRPSERISLSPEPEAELISIDPSQQVLPDSSADISIISSSSAVSVPSEEDADSSVLVLSTLETLTLSGEKSSPSSPIPSRSPIPSSQPASPPSQTLSSPLTQILTACSQPLTSTLPSFTSVLASHSFFPSSTSSSLFRPTITKIGEATYSEVYSISPSPTEEGGEMLVMKVIPLLSDEQSLELEMTKLSLKPEKPEEEGGEGESQQEDELEEADPVWSDARDVAREIELGRAVGVLDGFCTLREAVVVEGTYPPILLAEWDAYRTSFPEKSENARPSVFSSTQRYAILIQSYGGVDLESFAPSTTAPWAEAAGIFWSVGASLARAEEELRFEHRDLHLGQILIKPSSSCSSSSLTGPFDTACGFQTNIIDFGLSRLDGCSASLETEQEKGVWWTPFEEDHFTGKGRQWDVYRSMRDHIGEDDWSGYHPLTNLMWIQFILYSLTRHPKPTLISNSRRSIVIRSKAKPKDPAVFARELDAWKCLDATKKELEKVLKGRKGAGDWEGASDLVKWGRVMGWCS